MSTLRSLLREYLALRALGFKLIKTERMLTPFVEYAERVRATHITTELSIKWATEPADARPYWWARRLGVVRGFAQYCSAYDRRTEIPAQGLLPSGYRRISPFIFQDDDIRRLLAAARQLPSKLGLRPHTFATLYGLYAVTGLRTSEALHLDRDDVDLKGAVLTIRQTKFGKSRYVPMHLSTQHALQRYANLRDRLCPHPASQSFFLLDGGTRPGAQNARDTFVRLCRQIGLRGEGVPRGPRILDLRHRLAINTVTRWHRYGADVERQLPQLSTFLGHTHITHTQWYLTATPQLLRQVMKRVERSEQKTRP
jgi:integrase